MPKNRILSGIKPSGKLHVGNYLGALKNFVALQDQYESYFMIADLHAMTERFSPQQLRQDTLEVILDFLASGLDPKRSVLFLQSDVPEHVQLAWIFSCVTPVGALERMTQYKDFVSRGHSPNVGLFTYPVLQAVDILIYKPKYVPVGEDQKQHLELTNHIGKWFNHRFGEVFQPVEVLLTETPRVMSILEPIKKMSKSLGDAHCIYLSDEPEVIYKKLKKAVTDSGPVKSTKYSPGVANLFDLLKNFGTPEELQHFEQAHKDGSIRYAELKETVARSVADFFSSFRKKRRELAQKPKYIHEVLADGATRAQKIASATLKEVYKKVGLRRRL